MRSYKGAGPRSPYLGTAQGRGQGRAGRGGGGVGGAGRHWDAIAIRLSGVGEGLGMHWGGAIKQGPSGPEWGRVGPGGAGWGWACIDMQLNNSKLVLGAEWGGVGPGGVGHALGFN